MKKHLPFAAVTAVAALVLAGCLASPDDDSGTDVETEVPGQPEGSTETAPVEPGATTSVDDVSWETGDDGLPVLNFAQPGTTEVDEARSVTSGDGDLIEEGAIVSFDYTLTSGADGALLDSTYERGAPEQMTVDQNMLIPALHEVMEGASVGEEIIFASIDQTNPGNALYWAITVTDVRMPLSTAEGTAVEPEEGLPEVTLDEDGKPSIEVGDAEEPEELVVQPLIEGEGEPLELGQTALVHYSGWLWDGTQFDSSWERGAPASFQFAQGSLIAGWTDGLAGHSVGSQVLLVVPAELGYGEQGSGEAVPPNATLIFVVDILDAQ